MNNFENYKCKERFSLVSWNSKQPIEAIFPLETVVTSEALYHRKTESERNDFIMTVAIVCYILQEEYQIYSLPWNENDD